MQLSPSSRWLQRFTSGCLVLLLLLGLGESVDAQLPPVRPATSAASTEKVIAEAVGRLVAVRTVYRYATRRYEGGRTPQDAAFERALPRRTYETRALAWLTDTMAPLRRTERNVVVSSNTGFGPALASHLHSLGLDPAGVNDAEPSAQQPPKLQALSRLDNRGTVLVSSPAPFIHSAYDPIVRNRYVRTDEGALVSCTADTQCAVYSDEFHASCSKGLGAFKYQPPTTGAAMSSATAELERIGAAKGYCVYGAQFVPGQNVVLLGRSLADPIPTVLLTRLRDAEGNSTGLLPGLANTSAPSCKTSAGSVLASPAADSNCHLVEAEVAADNSFNYLHAAGQTTNYFMSPADAAAYPDLAYFTLPGNLPAGVYAAAIRYRPSAIITATSPAQAEVVAHGLLTALGATVLPSYASTTPVLLRVTGDKQDCPYYTYSLKHINPVVSEEVWDDPEIAFRVLRISGSQLATLASSSPSADGISSAMTNPSSAGVTTLASQKLSFDGLDEGEVVEVLGAAQVTTRVCRGDAIALVSDLWESDGGKTPVDAVLGTAISAAILSAAFLDKPLSVDIAVVGLVATAAISVLQAIMGAIQHAVLPEFLGQDVAVYSQLETRLLTHAAQAGLSVATLRKHLVAGTISLPSLTASGGTLHFPAAWEKPDVIYSNTPRMNGEDSWLIDGGFFHEGVYDEIHELVSFNRVGNVLTFTPSDYIDRLQARYKMHYRINTWGGSGAYGTLRSR